ncbi:MAG: nucleotide pyrophosphatase/phosphodiesterase family protein, partial [Planctomycetota bacterium]
QDLAHMPALTGLMAAGGRASLSAAFPAVTCPVQVGMTAGCPPDEHGVVANGFFWRDRGEVEMWTAWNEAVQRPQLWDRLHEIDPAITSAVWFPLLAKGCGADYVCTPAPIHNPDGSESLWCYTKPQAMYGELRDALGHFPLKHFWGPMAGIPATEWIVDSAVHCAREHQPRFFYIYVPHLDYASQKYGPDSPEAVAACSELDTQIAKLADGCRAAYGADPLWIVASEYAISPVDHVAYPNRVLREAGLLAVTTDDDGREQLDFVGSQAWALVDHQFSHVFVKDNDPAITARVVDLFTGEDGIAEVLDAEGKRRYRLHHERSGDVVLVSTPGSWQAYYWWNDDVAAPAYARTVDIHRKPGYDPVELFFDPAAHAAGLGPIPLDATLVRGSHGAPVVDDSQRGVLLASDPGLLAGADSLAGSGSVANAGFASHDVFDLVLRAFGG